MSDGEVPEGRCGFVLEPADTSANWAVDTYESETNEWYEDTEAVCCWRKMWEGSDNGRCIWHAENDDKSADALIEARADGSERLDGAYLPAVELGDSIDFRGCNLRAANFDGTGLQEASFVEVDGQFTQFNDTTLLMAQFSEADLWVATFLNADLRYAKFSDTITEFTQFLATNLRGVQFTKGVLRHAQFPNANLGGAEFSNADLQHTSFKNATLQDSQFSNANLRHAEFPNAYLRDTNMTDANLHRTEFSDAYLRSADLADSNASDARFTGAILKGADLTEANFSDADLTDIRLHDAHFRDVRINARTDINKIAPEEADADWFAATDLPPLDRLRWWWTWWRADPESLEAHLKQLDRAHTVYRTIQRLYRENSMPEEIDEYHVRAKDVRRKQAIIDSDWLRWLYLAGQRWVMRYGERPRRVVGTSLGVILVSALLYPLVGGINRPPPPDGTTRVAFDAVPLVPFGVPEPVATVLTSLYFSVVTFTTLGYGDLQPATGVAQAVATVESLVGALLMALLVYVLGRRATR